MTLPVGGAMTEGILAQGGSVIEHKFLCKFKHVARHATNMAFIKNSDSTLFIGTALR